MKLVDANLLLYAVNQDAPKHERARAWLERALRSDEAVGFAWTVLLAFLRLSTRSVVFPRPLRVEQALDVVAAWLAEPAAVVVHPGERHARLLRDLLLPLGAGGNLTSDAHLAAIALEHGAEICSCDADFARFAGVRWLDPLAAASG